MRNAALICLINLLLAFVAQGQTTEFTFQGRLTVSGAAATTPHDFEFRLFGLPTGGTQIGATVSRPNVTVVHGVFVVPLDFGEQFDGTDRWLRIDVRPVGGTGFETLTPRQRITSVPYTIKSGSATVADSLSTNCVLCVTNGQILSIDGSKVTGAVANASTASTANNALNLGGVAASEYVTNTGLANTIIRNQTTQQPASNFNIQGNGTVGGTFYANVVNAATEYRMDGFRILGAPTGTANLYAGFASGDQPGTGTRNSAFGYYAGEHANSGGDNSFFGHFSGRYTVGGGNSFFGSSAGLNTAGGINNAFFGINAGLGNTLGSNNTMLGAGANVISNNLNFATAIGSGATVAADNTIVLGRSGGLDRVVVPGNTQILGNLSLFGTLNGNGSGLSNLNASSFTVGTLPTARGGTGLGTSGAAGNLLRSDGSSWTSSPLTNSDIPDLTGSYIQNNPTVAQTGNFHVSGDGRVGGTFFVGSPISGALGKLSVNTPGDTLAVRADAGGIGSGLGFGGQFSGGRIGVSGYGTGASITRGVYGVGSGATDTSYGVYGQSNNSTSSAVGYGLYGEAVGVGTFLNIGVYGRASGAATNWAGVFQGNVLINPGNLGIGTTPVSRLHLREDVAGALGPVLTLTNGGGSGNTAIDFEGYDTGANPPAARIESIDDTNFSAHLSFKTKASGASGNALVERMRIHANGALSLNGSQGQTGQVLTSNGPASAQWRTATNLLYQQTNMRRDSGSTTPPANLSLPIPGLNQSIVTSGNAKILIHFNVYLYRNCSSGCVASDASVDLNVNGIRANRVTRTLPTNVQSADFSDFLGGSWVVSVGAGTHTVEIAGFFIGSGVTFGGGGTSNLIVQVIPE